MEKNNSAIYIEQIKSLWRNVEKVSSEMKNPEVKRVRVTANENPLRSELLGYCFDKILGFDIKYRPFEKINYVIIFKYKGTYAVAVDRKMDYYIEIESQFKNEFMVVLNETKKYFKNYLGA